MMLFFLMVLEEVERLFYASSGSFGEAKEEEEEKEEAVSSFTAYEGCGVGRGVIERLGDAGG